MCEVHKQYSETIHIRNENIIENLYRCLESLRTIHQERHEVSRKVVVHSLDGEKTVLYEEALRLFKNVWEIMCAIRVLQIGSLRHVLLHVDRQMHPKIFYYF